MTVGLKNKAALLLLLLIAACLAGCSSVMRPPPAAAYMDSYAKDGAVGSFGLSYYAGDLENGRHENNSYSHYSYAELFRRRNGDRTDSVERQLENRFYGTRF